MITAIKEKRNQLKDELSAQNREIEVLQGLVQYTINRFENNQCNQAINSDCNLCKRRMRLVGCLSKLQSFCEKLVLEMTGVCDYHDGMCPNGESILQQNIHKADSALCPVVVFSHVVCQSVK